MQDATETWGCLPVDVEQVLSTNKPLLRNEKAIHHVAHVESITGITGSLTRLQILPLSQILFRRVSRAVPGAEVVKLFAELFAQRRVACGNKVCPG